jgi:photosystem II stability/assembly factor-like uncharacterized protein
MFDSYIGTMSGVYRLGDGGLEPLGLEGKRVWAIHAFPANGGTVVLAGSYGDGMFRSADGGRSWQPANDGLTASAFRTLTTDPLNAGAILAGTEPGRAYRSHDGGQSWQELTGILDLPEYENWYLPYSPRAGALRNFYAPPGGNRLMGSLEVGGLLDSPDGGASWRYCEVGHDHDIHHITGHPDDPDLLYASLGYAGKKGVEWSTERPRFGGIARSRDGGRSWQKLETDYTRATIIPPSRHDLLLAGPAPKVSEGGRIVVSSDGGDTWQPAGDGIDIPMDDMVELFVAAPDDSIWAVCSGGRLLRAEPGEWHWRSALPAGAEVNVQAVSFV